MYIPRWIVIAAEVVAAIPFGWLLGVAAARLLLGPEFGVFPVLTIPLGWIAAFALALAPKLSPALRLAVLTIGSGALFVSL